MGATRACRRRVVASSIFVIAALAVSLPLRGQTPANSPEKPVATSAETELTVEVASTRLKALEENKELDAALQSKLVGLYKQALEQLQAVADSVARTEQHTRLTAEAPETLGKAKDELAAPVAESMC
jgi:hypothetical protein